MVVCEVLAIKILTTFRYSNHCAMREEFLHHLWMYKKFQVSDLQCSSGKSVQIINVGQYTQQAGPDFFNAQIVIDNQKWAGNVEIHLKSSDWYVHHHEQDSAYDNVILHVVWEHDVEIFREDNNVIPTLELKKYVAATTLESYERLMMPKRWIFCENDIATVDPFLFKNWQERLFFERLERKLLQVEILLKSMNNDWEATLFVMLAKSFGLNSNGNSFLQLAQSIPFQVILKERYDVDNLVALFFGRIGFLDQPKEEVYYEELKKQYDYLIHKYQLKECVFAEPSFFKHRPDNFPTIRLVQLAQLYHLQQNLFSSIIASANINSIEKIMTLNVPEYWETHYQFDKVSPKKRKPLSKSFIQLQIINTIVPLKFAYAKSQGKDVSDEIIGLVEQLTAESNSTILKFVEYGIEVTNAFETQALLQLKNEYCDRKRCLECAIGTTLLKGDDNAMKVCNFEADTNS